MSNRQHAKVLAAANSSNSPKCHGDDEHCSCLSVFRVDGYHLGPAFVATYSHTSPKFATTGSSPLISVHYFRST